METSHHTTEKPEAPTTLAGIVFKAKTDRHGKVTWKSDDPKRKIVILDPSSPIQPKNDTASYLVEVVSDSKPGVPSEGKLTVRILVEQDSGEDVPLVEGKEKGGNKPLEFDKKRKVVYVLETEVPYNEQGGKLVPRRENFTHFTLDQRTLETLEKIATAVELRQPCLLEGDTSTSKTSSIEYLAMITNHEVIRINLNGQTDTSELIGKFVPNDGQMEIEFDHALAHPERLKPETRDILLEARRLGRTLTILECQKVATLEGLKIADWRWQDGVVPQSMKRGAWLILDEVNLAEPQILERLNPVLERVPSLTLSENGGSKIGPGGEDEIDKRWRIFGTKNPADWGGRNAMTPAGTDRWTSYKYVENPTEADYTAMMQLMVYGVQPSVTVRGRNYVSEQTKSLFPLLMRVPGLNQFLFRLAKFQVGLEAKSRTREIGKGRKEKYVFTRRGLLEFMSYLETKSIVDRNTHTKTTILQDPKLLIQRALQYYFLDKIVGADDLKVVRDHLDAIGISDAKWTLGSEIPSPTKSSTARIADAM